MPKAPPFTLQDASEKEHKLSDYQDKTVILYFYPKDSTPGCTIEAIDFSKLKGEFNKANAVVIGISKDSCKSHQKFIDKESLTILLLSDPEHKTMDDYNVWKELQFMGRKYMGTERSTFIIKDGKIVKEYRKVKVKDHAQEVLEEVKKL